MDQQQILNELAIRAKSVGLSMSEVCKEAGIHPTTFSRWRQSDKNPEPKGAPIPSVARIEAVIRQREAATKEAA